MRTATNPETGETAILVDNEWKPISKTATNEKGQKAYLVGNEWVIDDSAPVQTEQAKSPSGYIQGLRDPVSALAQFASKITPDSLESKLINLNNIVANKFGVKPAPGNTWGEMVRNQEAQYQQQRKDAGEEGTDWGRLGGNVINPLNLTVAARIPTGVSILGKIGMGAASGSILGALQPVTSENPQDFASEKAMQAILGGVFGAGTSAAMQSGSWAWNQIKKTKAMTNPEGRLAIVKDAIRRWAGKDRADIMQALDDLDNYKGVPNSPVTSSDVIAAGNIKASQTDPRMFGRQVVAAQEGLTRSPDVTSDLASIGVKQQSARMKALESIIPDENLAIKARNEATEKLYEQANNAIVPVAGNSKLQSFLLRIPKDVLRQANKAAEINGEAFLVKGNLPKQLTGKQMHYIKMSLDDAITSKNNPGITATVQRNLSELKDDMLALYEYQNPVYGKARQTYREMSRPINQAQVLKAMKQELEKPGGGERVGPFLNILGKGETALLKRSTGMPRFEQGDLDKILDPKMLETVNKISGELARDVKTKDIFSKAVTHNAGKEAEAGMIEFPRILEQNLVIANYFLGRAKEKIIPEMNQMAADILKDPQKLRDVLQTVPKNKWAELVKNLNAAAKPERAVVPALSSAIEEGKR